MDSNLFELPFRWLTLTPNLDRLGLKSYGSSSSLLPVLLSWLGIDSFLAADLRWTVWFLAAMGILYQQLFHEKYKWLETIIYVIIGLVPALPFVHGVSQSMWISSLVGDLFICCSFQDEFQGVWELKMGGACYIIGLIFFKMDGRIPLAHAIWHLHVAMGASVHYYAVFTHLMG